jgi:hypothetical protein
VKGRVVRNPLRGRSEAVALSAETESCWAVGLYFTVHYCTVLECVRRPILGPPNPSAHGQTMQKFRRNLGDENLDFGLFYFISFLFLHGRKWKCPFSSCHAALMTVWNSSALSQTAQLLPYSIVRCLKHVGKMGPRQQLLHKALLRNKVGKDKVVRWVPTGFATHT